MYIVAGYFYYILKVTTIKKIIRVKNLWKVHTANKEESRYIA